ncbi:hypothetical protein G8O24_28835 [Bradyrhizobium sp. INPA01-394B]|uniref:Uncharacterized protein n=1 Tax=Bradyrhizobium campsiandrae TaxID=1729892 RepID=A0ABR7U4P9_9BRAD|nr:hypothetical protein [Bradyrhizobium campsiandrae]MBC9881342.1 hypothetical protein [Bradyrhizobium campsiandrae]MBC9978496.1 hypothetical protein [Bradyrhizobium campsiandrae]
MNHSVYTADKATHLKVVVFALLTSLVIMAITLTARLAHPEVDARATATQTVFRAHPGHAVTELARLNKHPI